ncbi:MAG: hypothetical protein HY294_02055 [Candidatus Rokubacteria bacterium]|nr:hypothetical protein [Candidatus Rokubacteria bacterium]
MKTRASGWTLLLLALQTAPAWAQGSCKPISSLPTTLDIPGVHCLTGPLSTSAASPASVAIEVTADDIVLDLGGYRIQYTGPAGATSIGIHASNRRNITVRNGTIRGFGFGINLGPPGSALSAQHVIDGMRVDSSLGVGIFVIGAGSIVRNNQVIGSGGPSGQAHGIFTSGAGVRVVNNDVVDTHGAGTFDSHAIQVSGDGVVVEGNRLSNPSLPSPGKSYGVRVTPPSATALIVDNRVTIFHFGVYFSPGTGGKYRDNLTSGAGTPYTGGTDAGNNNENRGAPRSRAERGLGGFRAPQLASRGTPGPGSRG